MAKASATAVGGDLIHTRTTAGTEESGVAVIGEDGTDNVLGPLVQVGTSRAMPTAGVSYATQSGTITTATSTVTLSNIGAAGNATIYIYGTYAGVNATFEISPDNTNWFPVGATREDNGASETSTGVLPANTIRAWTTGAPGFAYIRVRATAWTSGTANVAIVAGTYPFEPMVSMGAQRKLATYRAVYRQAARPNWLANAFGAAGRKQYATIHHAATATKTVKLRRVRVAMEENTVASFNIADLVKITTAPATGNPAITPGIADSADAAAEATCLALPTTAGTEGTVFSSAYWDAGVIAGAATTASGAFTQYQDLLPAIAVDNEVKAPTIRPGVLEGWAVTIDVNAATNPKFQIEIEFTEE